MEWNLNGKQRSKAQNQSMDVGLYFDHINVCICINMFNKYLQGNTQRNTLFLRVCFSYNLLILYDPHLLLDEDQEMP